MKIGIPKALLYYRYGYLWEKFFRELGCEIVVSEDTCASTLSAGMKSTVDENCLPLKIFMGHVSALIGRCDYIFVPRFMKTGREEEYCVRFWGLPDLVRNTFVEAQILSYNLHSERSWAEPAEFIRLGHALHKSPLQALRAYDAGIAAQQLQQQRQIARQNVLCRESSLKVLLAAQPYLLHDAYISTSMQEIIVREGGTILFSDCCEQRLCRNLAKNISRDLYWTMNKEIIGAIEKMKGMVDGIILLTAFPCGTDSLVNELVMRRVKDVPLIQILLDEHQSASGLETRIESFMDILQQRRAYA